MAQPHRTRLHPIHLHHTTYTHNNTSVRHITVGGSCMCVVCVVLVMTSLVPHLSAVDRGAGGQHTGHTSIATRMVPTHNTNTDTALA